MRERGAPFHVVPIQQTDVFAAVLDQLVKLIESGDYQPGDRLPSERELAQALAVSRVGVREALKVLESRGKVTRRQGAGTFVLRPHGDPLAAMLIADHVIDDEFLGQLVDARAAIEVQLVELAAERATEEELSDLREILDHYAADQLNDAEPGPISVVFEMGVARAAHSPLLASLQTAVNEVWVEAWSELGLLPGTKQQFHLEHVEIYEALVQKDSRRATELMRRHVDRSLVEVTGKSAVPPNQPARADGKGTSR